MTYSLDVIYLMVNGGPIDLHCWLHWISQYFDRIKRNEGGVDPLGASDISRYLAATNPRCGKSFPMGHALLSSIGVSSSFPCCWCWYCCCVICSHSNDTKSITICSYSFLFRDTKFREMPFDNCYQAIIKGQSHLNVQLLSSFQSQTLMAIINVVPNFPNWKLKVKSNWSRTIGWLMENQVQYYSRFLFLDY